MAGFQAVQLCVLLPLMSLSFVLPNLVSGLASLDASLCLNFVVFWFSVFFGRPFHSRGLIVRAFPSIHKTTGLESAWWSASSVGAGCAQPVHAVATSS